MPEARIAQIDGRLSSVDAEYSSPTCDRLSDSKGIQEDRMRRGV